MRAPPHGKTLDRGYIRAQIASMMGEDDARVVRWDELVRADAEQQE